jgi:hypothetical protein
MDFIEKLFGLEPDGGSGVLEVSLLGLLFAVFVLVWLRVHAARTRTAERRQR